MQSGSRNNTSALIGIILSIFVIIIYINCFLIESIPSQRKLLAWSSRWNNKISIVEIEKKQQFAKFDGVKLNEGGSIFQLFNSDLSLATTH